ncbi:MAG: hypothetical protein JKY48_10735, partial [Flavobacteriales bacterium]|nr:hypothetical protein [Flavobacteriales bacterium]
MHPLIQFTIKVNSKQLLRKYLFIIAVLITSVAKSQQYIPIKVKMPATGFSFDTTSFQIVKVIDQRRNQLDVGFVFVGILDLAYPAIINNGVKITYKKFFEKGMKNTVKGKKELVISFRDLVYAHDEVEVKKRKEIQLGIKVDYYENRNGNLTYLFTDHESKVIHS